MLGPFFIILLCFFASSCLGWADDFLAPGLELAFGPIFGNFVCFFASSCLGWADDFALGLDLAYHVGSMFVFLLRFS